MTICKKCKNEKVEWVEDKGKWRLYEGDTGKWHNENCKVTADDINTFNQAKLKMLGNLTKNACRHGILKTTWCDNCENERVL